MGDRKVQCVKLGREEEGLDRPPFKNELGKRLFENVSKPAWREWLEHSKKLINEYRIDLLSKEGSAFLLKECEKFFFGEGSALPPDFKPEGEGGGGHGHDHGHGHGHGHSH
jgi:Fe-S cluster biosynthesis and repair protein YggX